MGMVEVDLPTGYEACLSGHDDCLKEVRTLSVPLL